MTQSKKQSPTASKKRWLILAMVFLGPYAFLFSMQAAPPLIPTIIDDFSLSYAQTAGLMLFVALPAMLLSIPGGFLADRYGNKRMSVIGLSLVCLGTVFTALAPSFALLEASRALLGIGGALLLSAAPPLLFQWFAGRELGLAMGIWALNMPLATVVAFNLLGRIAIGHGWRADFWIAAGLAVIILILFILFVEEKRLAPAPFSLAALKKKSIWLLAIVWGTFNMAVLSLTTWGKTIFVDFRGVSDVQADFLASLIMIMAFATPLTGYLAGRLGRCRRLILVAVLGMTVCLALVPAAGGGLIVPLLVVLGLFGALMPPCVFALPPELVGAENTGLGFGVLNTTLNLGVVVGPLLVGRVLDTMHTEVAVFATMAAFAAVGAVFGFILKAR
ncbi:MAG: MFS transporter [Chloroflexota bacterium]